MGLAAAAMLTRKPNRATIHGVEVVPSVAPIMTPIACEKVTESGADEADDGRVKRRLRIESATVKSAPNATALNRPANEFLERAAQRVAGKAFQTFGEVVDSEQEQAESTQ